MTPGQDGAKFSWRILGTFVREALVVIFWPSLGLPPTGPQPSYVRTPELEAAVQGLMRAEKRGRITYPKMFLHALLLMQPMMSLNFWAGSSHCCIMLSFSSSSNPTSSFSGLLSIHPLKSLCLCLGLPLALSLVYLHEVHMGLALKSVRFLLDGIPSL